MGFLNFRRRPEPTVSETTTLHDALRRGLVTLEVRGVGGGQTASVQLRLVKLTDAPIRILVPRGTALVPFERPPLHLGEQDDYDTETQLVRPAERRAASGGWR